MFNGCNLDVQVAISKSGYKQYEVAEKIGIKPSNFCVWFRTEMPEERKQKIYKALKELKAERG